jgi:hypothetical protein
MNKIDGLFKEISELENMLKLAIECSDESLTKRIKTMIFEMKKQANLYFSLSSTTSSQNLLTEKSLEIISSDNYTIPKDLNSFDDYSIDLIKWVVQINNNTNVKSIQSVLKRFDKDQLNRHLDNLLNFLLYKKSEQKTVEKIIKLQLSLLDSKHLIESAKGKKGVDSEKFFDDFFLILKAADSLEDVIDPNDFKKRVEKFYDWIGENYGELKELLFGDLKSLIIADDIISSEVPSSVWSAQGVLGMQLAKSQSFLPLSGPPTMLVEMAIAAKMIPFNLPVAVLIAALGLTPLFIPLALSLSRKIYLQWFLSAPLSLDPLSDYTKKNRDYTTDFIGREDVFKKILKIWKQKKHPILVGAPGTGKTTIFMQLGQLIVNGAIKELQGKTLYAGSAALLMGENGMSPPLFPRVVDVLQRYKKNVILALDEVHAFAQDEKVFTLLRSVTDQSKKSLPYCIFATTPEEYEKTIAKDESLSRRLTKIDIKALDKNDLLNLLQKEAKLISPQISMTEEALIKIYDEAKGLQNESRQLLHKIIMAAESINMDHNIFQERYEKKSELELKKLHFKNENNDLEQSNLISRKIEEIREELNELDSQCDYREKTQEMHTILRTNLVEQKNSFILESKLFFKNSLVNKEEKTSNDNLIKKLKDQTFNSKEHQEKIKNLIFKHYFSIPHQIVTIRQKEKFEGLISLIDTNFVENFINKTEKEIKEVEAQRE